MSKEIELHPLHKMVIWLCDEAKKDFEDDTIETWIWNKSEEYKRKKLGVKRWKDIDGGNHE